MRVEFQPAYILHSRPYRDTSLIVDFLTPEFGRISAVVRGVRQRKGNKRQLLNSFNRLLISWQGKGDLKLLTGFESDNSYLKLVGNHLYSGFYLNELLVRLLPEMDAHQALFFDYENSLIALNHCDDLEPLLRTFEFHLLAELGYAIDFTHDAYSQQPIEPDIFYSCDSQSGFFAKRVTSSESYVIKGEYLLDIAAGDYTNPETRIVAKYVARLLLKPLLGNKPLKSREFFNSSSKS